MKITYFWLAAPLAALTLSSCLFEEDDCFEESASVRIEQYNENVQALLVSPQYGWRMQYFPNTGSRGYNIMTSFTASGVCKAACIFAQENSDASVYSDAASRSFTFSAESPSKYREASSLYQMEESNGSVLAMVSYNDIISGFVAPQTDGTGYAGDDHFVVLSATDDEILLKGDRYGARLRMVPAQGDWKEELTSIYQTNKDLFTEGVKSYYLMAGDSTFYCVEYATGILVVGSAMADRLNYQESRFSNALTSTQRSDISNNNAAYVTSASVDYQTFITAPDGIRLQTAYQKAGVSGQTFTYNADSSALVSGDMKLVPTLERYMAMHNDVWSLDTTQLSGGAQLACQSLYSTMSSLGFKNIKVGLGRSTGTATSGNAVWGLVVTGSITVKKKSTTFSFAIGYDVDASQLLRNTLTLEATQRDRNFNTSVVPESATYHSLYEPMLTLATALQGTYSLTANNGFNPSTVTYASVADESSFSINN